MKKFVSFGSIGQFRDVARSIKEQAEYKGKDENNKPIFDSSIKKPIIEVTATEKLHGTNAAVCYSKKGGFWVQSRNNIITVENDNAGCAFNAYKNQEAWMNIINNLVELNNIDLNENIISVFYEWVGGNIQAKSALTNVEKTAMIFAHFKISSISETDPGMWLETNGVKSPENRIFNITDFPSYKFTIDFNEPLMSQNEMIKIVEEIIEPASPVGKAFNQESNVGEGIVCHFTYKDILFKFKVKGEKHSKSKVKTLKPVDNEKEQAKIDFANYATPAWRLEQAFQNLFGIENEKNEPNIKFMGDFIRAVINDIMKEELDILLEKNIEPKEVNSKISTIARDWFKEELDKIIMK